MEDIDSLLADYDPGNPSNKPDVTKQLTELKQNRENMIKERQKQQAEYNDTMNKINIADAKKLRLNHSEILCSINFV